MGLAHFGEDKRSEWVGLLCGLESQRLLLSHSGQKLFPVAEKRRAHWAVTAVVEEKGAVRFFFLSSESFFFVVVVKEQNSGGNSLSVVHPLMSWCLSGSGWILSC